MFTKWLNVSFTDHLIRREFLSRNYFFYLWSHTLWFVAPFLLTNESMYISLSGKTAFDSHLARLYLMLGFVSLRRNIEVKHNQHVNVLLYYREGGALINVRLLKVNVRSSLGRDCWCSARTCCFREFHHFWERRTHFFILQT